MARKVCVVTGSRADYGLLRWVLHDLRADPAFELQLVVTGMHLSREHGHTVDEIERDGFKADCRVEMLLASDTPGATCRAVALGVIGMSDALTQLQPELVLVLGDRFEILAAAQACLFHGVALAHIAGGDTTEGAFDESIRHAITKLAQLHFVTNELSAQRVRQMGEDPRHVHVVGSPGLDHLRRHPLLEPAALEAALGASLGRRNLLVTFHPVTLAGDGGLAEFNELLAALDALPADIVLWLSRPNADPGGRGISAALDAFAQRRGASARVHASLGSLRYLSLMAQCNAVVGNSSSGLYEAPSLHRPTVNIGTRQQGRLAAASVLHCEAQRDAIAGAIARALLLDCSNVVNPYGDGHSTARIVDVLRRLPPPATLLHKAFHRQDLQDRQDLQGAGGG